MQSVNRMLSFINQRNIDESYHKQLVDVNIPFENHTLSMPSYCTFLRHQVKKQSKSNLTSMQWWSILKNWLLETSSYERLHYSMRLQLRAKDLLPTLFCFGFILLSTLTQCGFIFHSSAGQQSPFLAQPISVPFYNLPKLTIKLNEDKACSETSFV